MALKQLMVANKIKLRKKALENLMDGVDFEKRSAELETAIEEAETDEEVAAVEAEVDVLETEKSEYKDKKTKLESEILVLEKELEQLNSKAPVNKPSDGRSMQSEPQVQQTHIEGAQRMLVNKFETRSQMLDRLNQDEVKEFYGKIREAVMNKRALTGQDLLIPQAVLDRIQPMIGDYSNLYREVEVVPLNGTARAILDGSIPEAVWTEMCDPVQELADAFSAVELDGFKVGGFIPVCNAVIEDSLIDLANHIEDRIARAIAKAIDKAILTGTGAANKQPEGIIPAIPAGSKVTSDGKLADVLKNLALVDTGEDGVGEMIAVMKRTTYYGSILGQTVVNTSDGRQVVQGVNNPNIAGLRVVFSQYVPANVVILGDFKKYLLGERRGVQVTSSTDVRFIEDQTVFKGTARYDGKPVKATAFAQVTIAPAGA